MYTATTTEESHSVHTSSSSSITTNGIHRLLLLRPIIPSPFSYTLPIEQQQQQWQQQQQDDYSIHFDLTQQQQQTSNDYIEQ